MFENLLVVGLVVIGIWILILGIFLVVSRQQPDVAGQIRSIEEQLMYEEQDAAES